MANTTGTYGFPYLELGDAPNIATGLQNLAQAIENKIILVDAAVAAINNLVPTQTANSTDETGFTSTSFVAGGTPVGLTFTAPASGAGFITFSSQLSQNITTQATFQSGEMKTGAVVGSGTLVGSAANSDRAIVVGRSVTAGAVALLQASRRVFYTGLTPGAAYNFRLMHCVDGGSGTINFREVIWEPSL